MKNETQITISKWALETFGPTPSNMSCAERAREEMHELICKLAVDDNCPMAAEECADTIIVLYRLMTMLGADVQEEINRKMAINRRREWRILDGHGYHIKGAH